MWSSYKNFPLLRSRQLSIYAYVTLSMSLVCPRRLSGLGDLDCSHTGAIV